MIDALVAMIAGPLMWIPGLNIFVGYLAFGGGGALAGLIITLLLGGGAASNEGVRTKVKDWWDILGVSPDASKQDVTRAYRERAKSAHPDAGGSDAAMTELNKAREQALRTLRIVK
jgi:DnaJ-domain-containing protein 1